MTELLLIGSDQIFRQALAVVVGHQLPECRVRAQVSTATQALELLGRALPVDVAIVDLEPRVGDAVELVRQLVRQRPGVAVLALTTATTAELALQLRVAGAVLVVDKSASLDTVLDCVQRPRSSDAA